MITRLTGIDPDRLPEEKERGMTIDIGFAYYDTPDGQRIGIIDVPGHERFVRNMISGAGGIDAVLLVIAADDGWMPQSQEHFQIVRLLGLKHGLVALTKIDLVEPDWLDLVESDIREKLRGSFLEKAPVIRLSSVTGDGFERLRREIDTLAERVVLREEIGKPRLFIDRSFVLTGMGGVVTGTLRGGRLDTGQDIAVYPSRKQGKVRSLQSHNEQIETARPGRRTSISLSGIDKEHLGRGKALSSPEIVQAYPDDLVIAAEISIIAESPIVLNNRRRLLMILGTSEIEGEIRMFDTPEIRPGEKGIVFFKPFDPLLAFIGDRFILRLPTPQDTVGGGIVLDLLDRFPRKKERPRFDYLGSRRELSAESLVMTALNKSSFIYERDFLFTGYARETIGETIGKLVKDGLLDKYHKGYYDVAAIGTLTERIAAGMKSYLDRQPHHDGLPVNVISGQTTAKIADLETLLELMCDKGILVKKKNRFDLAGRQVKAGGEIKEKAEELERRLAYDKFKPPAVSEITGGDKAGKEALDYLLTTERVVKVTSEVVFHREAWNEILDTIRDTITAGESLTVSALREKLGTSRKYTVPILEYTDRLGITRRQGDIRIRGENFEKK